MKKINIDFRISGYVNELVSRLHKKYPGTEWSGIARVKKMKGYYLMVDIDFPEQENTTGNTEMTKKGLDLMLERIVEKDVRSLGEYNCRIHSHHSMSCFWSGTDEEAKKGFNDGNRKFRWSVVTAYSGDNVYYKCALNVFKPIEVEFEPIVSVEDFDIKSFMEQSQNNYQTYLSSVEKMNKKKESDLLILKQDLIKRRENIESLINGDLLVKKEDIDFVLELLNIEENEENISYCKELLTEELREKYKKILSMIEENEKKGIDNIEEEYNKNIKELFEAFGGNSFDLKIKELEDNIVKKYVYPYWKGECSYKGKQKGNLFYGGSKKKQGNGGLKKINYYDEYDDYFEKDLLEDGGVDYDGYEDNEWVMDGMGRRVQRKDYKDFIS